MRPVRFGLSLAVLAMLAGCGHSSPTATLSVTCGGSLKLAGASSIDVAADPGRGTIMSFPDPANPGHTNTLPVMVGQACTVAPVLAKGS